jgi:hypothetical protein
MMNSVLTNDALGGMTQKQSDMSWLWMASQGLQAQGGSMNKQGTQGNLEGLTNSFLPFLMMQGI